MSKKQKPCHCGTYTKLNQYGLTDENYIHHTWEACYFLYPLGA